MTGGCFGSSPIDKWMAAQEARENEGPPRVRCICCEKEFDGDEVDGDGLCGECGEKLDKEE
jgi:hypothetical protein